MFLGIEIGGTKLQLGLGRGDGEILALWRGTVEKGSGGDGIRKQIAVAVPELLAAANATELRGIGVGFGGPTDDATQSVIKSHHIDGWNGFPLAAWLTEMLQLPCAICNDADVAGFAEARFGAGRGYSPVFYITVGTGIGGGLIIDGTIYRGCGKGAAEIGHLIVPMGHDQRILEAWAAGWGIEARAVELGMEPVTVRELGRLARSGESLAVQLLDDATTALAFAIRQVIPLLCPQRIVIGGGVSLLGDDLFFDPLRTKLEVNRFEAFAGLTEIVPAALGEAVVIHGALALARQKFGE